MKKKSPLKKNFSIIVLFLYVSISFSQETLITKNDSWYYYDKGYLDESWIELTAFSHWEIGTSPLGYENKQIKTILSFGNDKDEKQVTKYFKKELILNNKYTIYECKIQRDDGAVFYLNGKEIFRENMPKGKITYNTLASNRVTSSAEDKFHQHFITNRDFKEGKNILSIEVHQAYRNSSDCIFSLELIGYKGLESIPSIAENQAKGKKELEYRIKELASELKFETLIAGKAELEGRNFNLQIVFYFICILFLSSLFGYYFIIERFKKRSNDENNKVKILTSENLGKDKEMITLSTNLLHNKQYFKEIRADLRGINTEDKATIKSITNQINYLLEKNEDWNILKKHFNAVHDNFYNKLLVKHPSISETELRHCLFIKLHMQTKEIARILLIDPRSVQTARYRIKKKMNLNENTDLRDYLMRL